MFEMSSLRRCAALTLVAASATTGCVREPAKACTPSAGCEAEEACLIARCRRDEALPVIGARRVVLEPTKIALVASRDVGDDATVALGKESVGDVLWLLAFDAGTAPSVEIKTATLALSVPPAAPAPLRPIALDAAVALESWEPGVVTWGRQPRIDSLLRLGEVDTRGTRAIRVDVTEIVKRSHTLRSYGIAVAAHPSDAVGATVHTGLGPGTAPRLELYLE